MAVLEKKLNLHHDCDPITNISLSLYALKEFAAHLIGLHAPATEPGFGFCQQHQLEFPNSLPSKYYPGPMLLSFSVQMETGVSIMADGKKKQLFTL